MIKNDEQVKITQETIKATENLLIEARKTHDEPEYLIDV